MRVNVYAEEITDRVEIISKVIDGHTFTGVRFYLELPVTIPKNKELKYRDGRDAGKVHEISGPFLHRDGDDDSSAVTFWGKRDLRSVLIKALAMLDYHYGCDYKVPMGLRTPVPAKTPDAEKRMAEEAGEEPAHHGPEDSLDDEDD